MPIIGQEARLRSSGKPDGKLEENRILEENKVNAQ